MDNALSLLGAGLGKGGSLLPVQEEEHRESRAQSPNGEGGEDGGEEREAELDDNDDDDDGDLDRAEVSTRGLNRGVNKEAEFNGDLDLQTVP